MFFIIYTKSEAFNKNYKQLYVTDKFQKKIGEVGAWYIIEISI